MATNSLMNDAALASSQIGNENQRNAQITAELMHNEMHLFNLELDEALDLALNQYGSMTEFDFEPDEPFQTDQFGWVAQALDEKEMPDVPDDAPYHAQMESDPTTTSPLDDYETAPELEVETKIPVRSTTKKLAPNPMEIEEFPEEPPSNWIRDKISGIGDTIRKAYVPVKHDLDDKIFSRISEKFEKGLNVKHQLDEKVMEHLGSLTDNLQNLRNVASSLIPSSDLKDTLIDLICTIVVTLYNMYDATTYKAKVLILSQTLLAGGYVSIASVGSKFVRAIVSFHQYFSASEENEMELKAQGYVTDAKDIFTDLFNGLYEFLTGKTMSTISLPSMPPHVSKMMGDVHKISNFAKAIDTLSKYLWQCMSWIYFKTTGCPLITDSNEEVINRALDWFDRYSRFATDWKDLDINDSKQVAQEALSLFNEVVPLEKELAALGMSKTNFTPFFRAFESVRSLAGSAKNLLKNQNSRVPPLFIWLQGNPGVGKSVLMKIISQDLWASEEARNMKNRPWSEANLYERKIENEYWEGYKNQFVVTLDDVFQMDEAEVRTRTALEIINMANVSAYPLHMADISLKDCTYFDSKILIASDNNETLPKNVHITSHTALQRRRDFVINVDIDDKYADSYSAGQQTLKKLKPGLNVDPRQVYKFSFLDQYSSAPIGKPFNYTTLLSCLWKRFLQKQIGTDNVLREFKPMKAQEINPAHNQTVVAQMKKTSRPPRPLKLDDKPLLMNPSEDEDPKPSITERISRKWNSRGDAAAELAEFKGKMMASRREHITTHGVNEMRYAFLEMAEEMNFADMDVDDVADRLQFCYVMKNQSAILHGLKKHILALIEEYKQKVSGYFGKHYILVRCLIVGLGFLSVYLGIKVAHKAGRRFGEWYNRGKDNIIPYGLDPTEYANIQTLDLTNMAQAGAQGVTPLPDGTEAQAKGASGGGSLETTAKAPIPSRRKITNKYEVVRPVHAQSAQVFELLDGKIRDNSGQITVHTKDGSFSCHFIMIKETLAMTVKHWMRFLDDGPVDITFKFNKNDVHDAKISSAKLTIIRCQYNDCTFIDLSAIQGLQRFADISNHLFLEKDLGANVSHVCMYIPERKNSTHAAKARVIEAKGCSIVGAQSYDFNGTAFVNCDSLKYPINTTVGDCGATIWVMNSKVNHKLVAIHVAGNGHFGIGSILYKENFDEMYAAVFETKTPLEPQGKFELIPGEKSLDLEVEEKIDFVFPPQSHYLGSMPPGMRKRLSEKSEIIPSLLFDEIQTHWTAPAALAPFKRDNVVISPLQESLTKISNPSPFDEQDFDKSLFTEIAKTYFMQLPAMVPPIILDDYQQYNGEESWDYVGRLRTNTAIGFSTEKKIGEKKRDMFEKTANPDDPLVPRPVLIYSLQKYEENCIRGITGTMICEGNLKDERRPLEKVIAGSTRLFTTPTLEHLILCRKYLGSMTESIGICGMDLGICLGVNPHGNDWKFILETFKHLGITKIIDGDAKAYDFTHRNQIVEIMIDMINDWYARMNRNMTQPLYTQEMIEEHNQVRRTLIMDAAGKPTVQIAKYLIKFDFGMCSGWYWTFVLNSLIGQITHRYCVARRAKRLGIAVSVEELVTKMYIPCGGDDFLHGVPDKYSFYTFETMQEEMAKIGYTYTDATKSGEKYVYRSIEEVNFLKRRFVLSDSVVLAPMEIDNILEILNYQKETLDPHLAIELAVEVVLRELFHHGKQVFGFYQEILNQKLLENGCKRLFLKSWNGIYVENYDLGFWDVHSAALAMDGECQPKDMSRLIAQMENISESSAGKEPKKVWDMTDKEFFSSIFQHSKNTSPEFAILRKEFEDKLEILDIYPALRPMFYEYFFSIMMASYSAHGNFSSLADSFYHAYGFALEITYRSDPLTSGYAAFAIVNGHNYLTEKLSSKARARETIYRMVGEKLKILTEEDDFFFVRNLFHQSPRNVTAKASHDDSFKQERNDEEILRRMRSLRAKVLDNVPMKAYEGINNQFDKVDALIMENMGFHAQMEAIDDILAEKVEAHEEVEQLTHTRDLIALEKDRKPTLLQEYYRGSNPYPEDNLSDVLTRKYKLADIVWSGANAVDTDIAHIKLPGDLMSNAPNLFAKFNRYRYARFNVVLEFRINGTQWHYGKVMLGWVPHFNYVIAYQWKVGSIYTLSTSNCSFISANTNTTVQIRIPYINPRTYLTSDQLYDLSSTILGMVVLRVLNPLRLSTSTSTPTLDISVWAHFENVEVCGPTLVAHMKKEQNDKSEKGIISSNLNAIANVAGAVKKVPAIPDIVKGGATLLQGVFNRLTLFTRDLGMNKPVSVQANKPVSNVTVNNLALGSGMNTEHDLQLLPGAFVANSPQSYGLTEDWHNLRKLCKKPGLFYTGSFDSSANVNDIIWSFKVTPTCCYTTTLVGPPVGYFSYNTPLSLCAYPFRWWRGTIRYRLEIVTSKFTAGRIRVAWHPDLTDPMTFGHGLDGDVIATVLEFCGDTSYNFSVPYLNERQYLRCEDTWLKTAEGANGKISISVVNPVISTSVTTDSTVYFNLYIAGSDDMDFLQPIERVHTVGTTRFIAPDYLQGNLVAQGMFDSNNLEEIFESEFPAIIKCVPTSLANVNSGEEISDIRTLLHRFYRSQSIAIAVNTWYKFRYLPLRSNTDALTLFTTWFLFHRGSYNWKFIPEYLPPARDPGTFYASVGEWYNLGAIDPPDYQNTYGMQGFAVERFALKPSLEVHEPYYHNLSMIPGYPYYDIDELPSVGVNAFFVALDPGWVGQSLATSIFTSIGDDFSFGWPVGCPTTAMGVYVPEEPEDLFNKDDFDMKSRGVAISVAPSGKQK